MEPLKHIICLEIIQLYCNSLNIVISTNRLNNNYMVCDLKKYIEVCRSVLMVLMYQEINLTTIDYFVNVLRNIDRC